jgi:hypothetical protein
MRTSYSIAPLLYRSISIGIVASWCLVGCGGRDTEQSDNRSNSSISSDADVAQESATMEKWKECNWLYSGGDRSDKVPGHPLTSEAYLQCKSEYFGMGGQAGLP